MKSDAGLFSGMVHGAGVPLPRKGSRRFPHLLRPATRRTGRVEVTAEGEESALVEFLTAIRESGMKHYIRDVETRWLKGKRHPPLLRHHLLKPDDGTSFVKHSG